MSNGKNASRNLEEPFQAMKNATSPYIKRRRMDTAETAPFFKPTPSSFPHIFLL